MNLRQNGPIKLLLKHKYIIIHYTWCLQVFILWWGKFCKLIIKKNMNLTLFDVVFHIKEGTCCKIRFIHIIFSFSIAILISTELTIKYCEKHFDLDSFFPFFLCRISVISTPNIKLPLFCYLYHCMQLNMGTDITMNLLSVFRKGKSNKVNPQVKPV